MSHISERLIVQCPEREASRHVGAFVAKHRDRDGMMHITLRLPMRAFPQRRWPAERCVIATLYPLHSARDPHPTYSVTWSTLGGGPFPEFAGALAVEGNSGDDRFGLIVSGDYEPPPGLHDALFDASLGRRLARTSARDLLRSIAEHVENSYAGHASFAHRANVLASNARVGGGRSAL